MTKRIKEQGCQQERQKQLKEDCCKWVYLKMTVYDHFQFNSLNHKDRLI